MAAETIASILDKASKEYKMRIGPIGAVADNVRGLTTGNMAIDHVLGVRGLPVGRIIELYGNPSSGKSTVALQTAAALQRDIIESGREEYLAYFDYEHAVDPEYASSLGLDLDHRSVIFAQPDSLEQGAAIARKIVPTGKVKLLIWDSVAEMMPKLVLDAETGQPQMAVRARLMSQFLQQVNGMLHANDCTSIFLNHLMEKISTGGFQRPGAPAKTTPGGNALKFYASVRVEFAQIKTYKRPQYDQLSNASEEVAVAADVLVTVTKNKVGPPMRKCTVRVRYGQGFDNFWSAMQILVGHKRVPRQSAFYYFEKMPNLVHSDMGTSGTGRRYIQGEEAMLAFADANPEAEELLTKPADPSQAVPLNDEEETSLMGGFSFLTAQDDPE